MEYIPSFIVPVEMVWFCERFFFEVVIAMVKDKEFSIEDTMSIKISFMHYMKWTRVMIQFSRNLISFIFFCYFFLFTIIVNR